MSGLIFAVNRFACFMENWNTIRIFCGVKPKKKTFSLIKILMVLIKKVETLDELEDVQNIKR